MASYGVVVYWPDTPVASEQILLHAVVLPAKFPAGMADSRAVLDTPPTLDTTYSVVLEGVEKATITFPAASLLGAISCPTTWQANPGDRLGIIAPATSDPTASGIAISILGEQIEQNNLNAVLISASTVSATMDRLFLKAVLSSESSISSRLREKNAFGPQWLESVSSLRGTLSDCRRLKCKMPCRKGSEFFGRLTVTHSPELFK